jgi:predicted CopG family antitoxin
MSKTLTVSEETYKNLDALAKLRGFKSIEQFLEKDKLLFERRTELERRQKLGEEMKKLREKILRENGVMPNSVDLIREDRER